ncbi:MAG: histidine--tRNA ligase [Nanoarchaeota archaeon]|nr:histidine--tRNA ligase [Nanoarchaeota archaeon]|tara:strand:+ start:1139 stop:2368 length:1230 start_codon:yes stop_codon:yes gene_type:complete
MTSVKGFRDFYPEEKRTLNYIFDIWKSVAQKYGYQEIDIPILEPVEIYNKSGEEIPEQIYSFIDKGKRALALRPETTPSVARMVKQKSSLKKPIKWYSISQCYRYERVQKGRSREFFQFNLDYLGTKSMESDAEVITTLIKILTSLKLTENDFCIKISNRKLINDLFRNLKILCVKDIARLLDKRSRISDKELKTELVNLDLSSRQVKGVLDFLNFKELKQIKIESEGLDELKELFDILKRYKLTKFLKLDLSIMRGFDYYTGTVFEAFDKKGDLRSIAGGGRYDNLAGMPGVGYGFGDTVLNIFLEEKKLLPELNSETDIFIIPIKNLDKCIPIAEELRKSNIKVNLDLLKRSISKNLDYANKEKIPYVLIIGEDELKKNKVKLKNMFSGEEKLTSVKNVIKEIQNGT